MYAIVTKKGKNWQFEYSSEWTALVYKSSKYTYFIDPDYTDTEDHIAQGVRIFRELNTDTIWDEDGKDMTKELGVSKIEFFNMNQQKVGEFNLDL